MKTPDDDPRIGELHRALETFNIQQGPIEDVLIGKSTLSLQIEGVWYSIPEALISDMIPESSSDPELFLKNKIAVLYRLGDTIESAWICSHVLEGTITDHGEKSLTIKPHDGEAIQLSTDPGLTENIETPKRVILCLDETRTHVLSIIEQSTTET